MGHLNAKAAVAEAFRLPIQHLSGWPNVRIILLMAFFVTSRHPCLIISTTRESESCLHIFMIWYVLGQFTEKKA